MDVMQPPHNQYKAQVEENRIGYTEATGCIVTAKSEGENFAELKRRYHNERAEVKSEREQHFQNVDPWRLGQ